MNITTNLKNKISQFITDYTHELTEFEKKQIHNRIISIKHKYDAITKLKKLKTLETEIDPMFFCFENLPTSGKEYWFLKFVSTKQNDNRQLITTFGSSVNSTKINGANINFSTRTNILNGFMTCWFFDRKKHLIFDNPCTINIDSKNITASKKNSMITSYYGSYPNYAFKLIKNNTTICSLKIKPPKDGTNPFEFNHFFKGLFGYALINLYFDFCGTLNGKTFDGKCYIQKVIVIGPFLPWHWGRIVFSNGSFFTYYIPHIKLYNYAYIIKNEFEFYDNIAKKTYYMNDISIEKYGTKFPRWVITNKKQNLFITLSSYSSHKFIFKRIGTFTYKEYITRVNDIYIEGEKINLKKLGSGIGLIEDTEGFII